MQGMYSLHGFTIWQWSPLRPSEHLQVYFTPRDDDGALLVPFGSYSQWLSCPKQYGVRIPFTIGPFVNRVHGTHWYVSKVPLRHTIGRCDSHGAVKSVLTKKWAGLQAGEQLSPLLILPPHPRVTASCMHSLPFHFFSGHCNFASHWHSPEVALHNPFCVSQ